MKRKHKNYLRPMRPFDKARIEDEEKIREEYGLKTKTEIWKAEAKIKAIREKAKKLISAGKEEQENLFSQLKKNGFNADTIAEILSLEKKDYLGRRLQTIIFKKGLTKTIKEARQLICHKKVLIDGRAVNLPGYIVPVKMEDKISLKAK